MTHQRASSSLGCFLLFVLLPLCASAAPKDPCKLLQRNLDQQIDDVKIWQKDEMQSCATALGNDSHQCRQLKQQHAQELRSLRRGRADRMAGCRGMTLAQVPTFTEDNSDYFLETYYRNRGLCVEQQQPHTNCYEEAREYLHLKHHHYHHHYSDSPSGNVKSASEYGGKRSPTGVQTNADRHAKQDAAATRGSVHDTPSQSAHRGSDHDNSSGHSSGRSDSSPAASSSHGHDSGGASSSGGSHASGGSSDSHASSSSAGSSSSGASHSSGGGGSSSSGSSSPGANYSGSASSGSSGASASSPASSPSHDSGSSRPK